MTLKSSTWSAALGSVALVFVAWLVGCETKQPPAKSTPKAGSSTASAAKPAAKPAAEPAVKPAAEPAVKPAAKPAAEQLPKVPLGLKAVPVPDDNPMTPEKVELGKMLYFDTRLSRDGKVSCATCHDPKMAWAEHEATSTGIEKQVGGRNSPSVINAAYAPAQFWDGRAASLEEQALGPIQNPIEMGHNLPAMIQSLSKIDAYSSQFKKVFGTEVNKEGVAKAIAAFERTILSGNSPYDRFKAGDKTALNPAQQHGMDVFKKAGCAMCHSGALLSGYDYYNAGVGMDKAKPDAGRKDVTKKDEDLGKFRVPSLREVANTAPYFHDGSAKTLEDAVALMAAGGKSNAHLSDSFESVREAKLAEQDRKDIVEFLKALSGEYPVIEAPKLP